MNNMVEKIQKVLDDNDLFGSVYNHKDLPIIYVEINWGDWKHDHLRTKCLLESIGCVYAGEDVTEEDGSDCYSAIHTYIVNM